MFSRALLLYLALLIHKIHSEETEDLPVDLLQVKYVQIDDYYGPLNAEMVELLRNVEMLDLRSGNFTPLNLNFLNPLKSLKKLSISNSHVELKEHDISSCCKSIKELELISNEFPEIKFDVLSHWPLEKLYCLREKIPKLEADFLKNTQMKDLTITISNIESIDDSAFNKLEQLESLNLERNQIKQITKAMLAPLKNVKTINLRNNLLEKLTTDMFPPMPNLEKIDVGHNPIKEFNLVGVKKLAPKLKNVDISGLDEIDTSKNDGVALTAWAVDK